jgi:hypothetical protein
MSSTTITITLKEKKFLESKAKVGWKTYYILRDDFDELSTWFSDERQKNRELVKKLKEGEEVDFAYLKTQFLELYEKVGELTDCPVCFETLTKANSEVPSCGHMICRDCKTHICNSGKKECPICKATYWVKNT